MHGGSGSIPYLCSVLDEEGFVPPLEYGIFAFGDIAEFDLNLGQGQHVCGGTHRGHKLRHDRLGSVRCRHAAS